MTSPAESYIDASFPERRYTFTVSQFIMPLLKLIAQKQQLIHLFLCSVVALRTYFLPFVQSLYNQIFDKSIAIPKADNERRKALIIEKLRGSTVSSFFPLKNFL